MAVETVRPVAGHASSCRRAVDATGSGTLGTVVLELAAVLRRQRCISMPWTVRVNQSEPGVVTPFGKVARQGSPVLHFRLSRYFPARLVGLRAAIIFSTTMPHPGSGSAARLSLTSRLRCGPPSIRGRFRTEGSVGVCCQVLRNLLVEHLRAAPGGVGNLVHGLRAVLRRGCSL